VVHRYGLAAVAYGENADDAKRPDRPGSRAATNHKVLRPLADPDWTRRRCAQSLEPCGCPAPKKPAAPCLAIANSAFPGGHRGKARQIETAEKALRTLGFVQSRVRHHGDVARIELATEDLERALSPGTRTHLHAAVAAAGFRFVAVDVLGIQSGAFHAVCPVEGAMTEDWQPDEAMSAFIELDHDRGSRRGYPEAVYCEGKTPEQVSAIARAIKGFRHTNAVHAGRCRARQGRFSSSCRTRAMTKMPTCSPGHRPFRHPAEGTLS
jgi:hypothetical protein